MLHIFFTLCAFAESQVLKYKNVIMTINFFMYQGSVMSCEYLLLNGARINCQDAEGKTPLHLATELGIC